MSDGTVQVTLFKPSGKYYTTETWRIPLIVPGESLGTINGMRNVIGPYDMLHSPDFRRISGGAVLIESQEPWGYPHLFSGEAGPVASAPERTEWTGQCTGGPDDGNLVTATVPRFRHEVRSVSWLDGVHAAPSHVLVCGWYAWREETGVFMWEADR